MRFRATDAVINSLTNNGMVNVEPTNSSATQENLAPRDDYNDIDQRKVSWHEVSLIEKPEHYEFDSLSPNRQAGWWYGFIIVDRKRHLVYLHATME